MEVLALAVAMVLITAISSHAFHSWLRQRERERLSSNDKAELTKRLEDLDRKLLELKNTVSNIGRR